MRNQRSGITRRTVLAAGAAAGDNGVIWRRVAAACARARNADHPSQSGQSLPNIGMGSWLTFDVGKNPNARARRVKVLDAFFAAGGGMIDSSPMYGTSEEIIGHCLKKLDFPQSLFAASKVWTISKRLGVKQMEVSRQALGHRSLRPDADPQHAGLANASADTQKYEG